jgi:hypothetical protein
LQKDDGYAGAVESAAPRGAAPWQRAATSLHSAESDAGRSSGFKHATDPTHLNSLPWSFGVRLHDVSCAATFLLKRYAEGMGGQRCQLVCARRRLGW